MKRAYLATLLIFGLSVVISVAQEKSKDEAKGNPSEPAPAHGFKITPEDIAKKNTVKFTTVSVERGKKIYDTQCAMCHGAKGDGKGDVVEEMKINPPDFTKPDTLAKRTDGELFAIVSNGSEAMPGQGTRMPDSRKWNLVNYVRALSGKQPEKSTGKEPEENVILVPQ